MPHFILHNILSLYGFDPLEIFHRPAPPPKSLVRGSRDNTALCQHSWARLVCKTYTTMALARQAGSFTRCCARNSNFKGASRSGVLGSTLARQWAGLQAVAASDRHPLSTKAAAAPLPKGTAGSLKCSGCGAGLQSHSDTGAGFLPRRAIERVIETRSSTASAAVKAASDSGAHAQAAEAAAAATRLICQRCYNAKHYGDLVPVETDEAQFREYIRAIR